jgi:hypothetical protein
LETPSHDFLQKVWDSGKEGYKCRTPDLKRRSRQEPPKGNLKPFGGFTGSSLGNPTFSFYDSEG